MSSINPCSPVRSPQAEQHFNDIENEILNEQNLPLTMGCDLNVNGLGQKNQQFQKFSNTTPSFSKMQANRKQSSLRVLSKFLMAFKKKSKNINENQRRYTYFQQMYEEKLFHPELKIKSLKRSKFLFDSNNFSYIVWQQLKLFYILFLLLFITFYWSYDDLNKVMSDQASIIYCLLIIDIFAQSNVSIIIKGQVFFVPIKIILDRVTIIYKYLSGTFLENIAFLISLVVLVKTNHELAAVIFYITGIQIFFQIINRLQDFYDFDFIRSEILKLIKLIVFINLLAHFMACIWHQVGYQSDDEHNWLDAKGIRNASKSTRYMYSFYWSVTTMVTVGYGDITPTNTSEMIVCVLVILISCGVFAFSLNLIGQVLQTYNQYQDKLNISFRTLNNYFKQHNISEQLQNRSKNYLEYAIREEEKESLNNVLNKLPSKLRQEIIEEAFRKMLPKIPVLYNNFSASTLNKASHCFKIQCFQPGDYIINQNSQVKNDQAVYFIEQGQVQVFEQQSKTELFDISSGQAFGLYEFFTDQQARYSLICKSEARIFKLTRNDFINLLTKDDFESFHYIKHCYQFNIPISDLNCQFCNSIDHFTENCKLFFFSRDISNIYQEKENQKQSRTHFERKNFRYQSLLHQNSTLEIQFQYLENYLQEHSIEQTEDVINLTKTVESNFNSALNVFKISENLIPNDQENNVLKRCISQHMKATMKSDTKLKIHQNERVQTIQEKNVAFEIDKIKNYSKYFKMDNSENLIQIYNKMRQKMASFQQGRQKIRKAMRFIQEI